MSTKNYAKLLSEKFGEPIGSYAGQPVVGVRDERTKCPECGSTYAIDGDEPESLLCHDCGSTYSKTGKLLNVYEVVCGKCGLIHVNESFYSHRSTPKRDTPISQARRKGVYIDCPDCEGRGCDADAINPCLVCGGSGLVGSCPNCGKSYCECIDEVAPPGKEKMVKALKKNPKIDNPWAVAWSAHNKQKK